MSQIHPTAVVAPKAELDPSVQIGAFALIGPDVRLGPGVVLHSHVVIDGRTEIGAETTIFPFACIGASPQDLRHSGDGTRLVVGARNQIREYVTIHPGTSHGGGTTTVGDDNLLMVGMHIGHDSRVGSNCVIANNVKLAGHVTVEDYAWISADSGIQQFCRVGEASFLAAKAGVMQDVAPFAWAHGHPARVLRSNKVGMERRGFTPEQIAAVDRAFRIVFRSRLKPEEAFRRVREELADSREAERMVAFLEKSEGGFARLR